jgi:hypothetical protein
MDMIGFLIDEAAMRGESVGRCAYETAAAYRACIAASAKTNGNVSGAACDTFRYKPPRPSAAVAETAVQTDTKTGESGHAGDKRHGFNSTRCGAIGAAADDR